jgi:hypothetical protein
VSACLASPAHIHIRIAALIAIHSSPMWGVQGSVYLPTEHATPTNCSTLEQGIQRRDCTLQGTCILPYCHTEHCSFLFSHLSVLSASSFMIIFSLFNFFISFFFVFLFAAHAASCSIVPMASQREKPKSLSLQDTKGLWTRLFWKHCTSAP